MTSLSRPVHLSVNSPEVVDVASSRTSTSSRAVGQSPRSQDWYYHQANAVQVPGRRVATSLQACNTLFMLGMDQDAECAAALTLINGLTVLSFKSDDRNDLGCTHH